MKPAVAGALVASGTAAVLLLFQLRKAATAARHQAKRQDVNKDPWTQRQATSDNVIFVPEHEIAGTVLAMLTSKKFLHSVRLVRKSWNLLKPDLLEPAMLRMYAIFVSSNAAAGALFGTSLNWEAQQKVFCRMMSSVIAKAHSPDQLSQMICAIGVRHFQHGVKPSYYVSMGKALVQSLQETLGQRMTPEMCEAWREFFTILSEAMVVAGDGMTIMGREQLMDAGEPQHNGIAAQRAVQRGRGG
ncbi:unnamed protein product [Chrysoparadoxa australica]